ncbi:ATP-binding protein [Vibrio hippocampi]|uniref:histidine kinase n=1 Tax=Vibrio hippocampi TaxID=654686 RepID=A0ABN8DJ45_9VIBR|nr:ATP-binding protein [Vibrio hippocampi]CAH0526603.1 Adaptive-response sensory-kinase SasA [Vibrio hippocampi]
MAERAPWYKRFSPNSLVARTLILTLLAVICSQGVLTAIWYQKTKQDELSGIRDISASMATMFASTVTFFQKLPIRYRHIVLDQIRNMGGTRFFVSFNKEQLIVEPIDDTPLKLASVESVRGVLQEKLPKIQSVEVDFSKAENLRLLKNNIYLHDLPKSWAHHTLTLGPLDPPILVVQLQIKEDEWLYIAALLPSPYLQLEDKLLSQDQVLFLTLSTTLLLILTFLLVRAQVKPLRRLAKAANQMSMDIDQPPLKEQGASELITATRAFNRMQTRIRQYIADRETLFSSISHDLKTPITRLRLRAELLDDDAKTDKFNQDLDQLEMMVKGALQCVKDTDLHENQQHIDLNEMVISVIETYNQEITKVDFVPSEIGSVVTKPLAMKRVLSNLIDNAVKYGDYANVRIERTSKWIVVSIIDQGPGIPADKLEAVFEPYVRLAKDKEGHGLGLGICKSILHGLGGDLVLRNRAEGGLEVEVFIAPDAEI